MSYKCCICLNKLNSNGKVTLTCGHSIHLNCFIECLKNDIINCPICRKKIPETITFYNFLNCKLNFIYEQTKEFRLVIKSYLEKNLV